MNKEQIHALLTGTADGYKDSLRVAAGAAAELTTAKRNLVSAERELRLAGKIEGKNDKERDASLFAQAEEQFTAVDSATDTLAAANLVQKEAEVSWSLARYITRLYTSNLK